MSSTAQIVANQKNAQSSTGPRTLEGKQTSSQNALKYGLTAKDVVLSFEDPAAFEAVRADLIDKWHPAAGIQLRLVDEVAAAQWRMMRVEAAQNSFLELEQGRGCNPAAILLSAAIPKFQKYAATYRRAAESAWKKLEAIRKENKSEPLAAKLQKEPNPRQPSEPASPPVEHYDFFAPLRELANQPILDFTKLNPPRRL